MNTDELAAELIAFDTTSPVEKVEPIRYIADLLADHSITATIHENNGVYSLTASTGDSEPHICFNGHMDVVPAGDGWKVTDPFDPKIEDGKLYGRGAADMKGGLAAQILAFIDLHESDDFTGTATLMVAGDEEIGGFDGTAPLLEEYDGYDYVIIGEPTNRDIQVGVRGLLWPTVTVRGTNRHASRPHLSRNIMQDIPAVLERLNDLEMTYEPDEQLPEPTLEVTTVETDGPQNSTPGIVRIGLDIRYVTGQSPESIVTDIQDALDPLDLDYSVTPNKQGGAYLLEDDQLRDTATAVIEGVFDREPVHTTEGGISDGNFFAEHDIPYIELGPREREVGHQTDEYANVDDLCKMRTAYKHIAQELATASAKTKMSVTPE